MPRNGDFAARADRPRRHGNIYVLIAHRIDDALEMADRILVLAAPARLAPEVGVGVTAELRAAAAAMGGEEAAA